MNYRKSSIYQLVVLALLFIVAFSCNKETTNDNPDAQYIKSLYADTLTGYDITSFEEHSGVYIGKAGNCDGYGACDWISFISYTKPKLGHAKFKFYSAGYECGWELIQN